MSEAEDKEYKEPPQSFPAFVWMTLSRIDVDAYLKPKEVEFKSGRKAKFDYLPWASAWEILMTHFPESEFEFDPPAHFEGTGVEQWVTVTIKDKGKEMVRRWWLPFLDYKNQPVVNPTSLQINNTRMRVLVKCLAMCGLGIGVYVGEDVPDKDHDAKPVGKSKSVRQSVLDEMQLTEEDEAKAMEWVEALREAMPNKDGIDQVKVTELYLQTRKLGDMTVYIYHKLNSWQTTAIGKIRAEVQEKERQAAVNKIQEQE